MGVSADVGSLTGLENDFRSQSAQDVLRYSNAGASPRTHRIPGARVGSPGKDRVRQQKVVARVNGHARIGSDDLAGGIGDGRSLEGRAISGIDFPKSDFASGWGAERLVGRMRSPETGIAVNEGMQSGVSSIYAGGAAELRPKIIRRKVLPRDCGVIAIITVVDQKGGIDGAGDGKDAHVADAVGVSAVIVHEKDQRKIGVVHLGWHLGISEGAIDVIGHRNSGTNSGAARIDVGLVE